MSVSKSMNNKRIKKGKLPLYEYKVLTINNSIYAPCINVKGNPDGNTRLHLRRGHIRNHPTAGKVWVTQCVVGNADHGVVDKDYRVKGGQS